MRAPLVVVCDGYYPQVSTEFQSTPKPVGRNFASAIYLQDHTFGKGSGKHCIEVGLGVPHAVVNAFYINKREIRTTIFGIGPQPSDANKFVEEKVAPFVPGNFPLLHYP